MDLIDILFPPTTATKLRDVSQTVNSQIHRGQQLAKQNASTSRDLGTVSLLLMATLRTLVDKGLITQEEILARIEMLDGLDGVKDGKLQVEAMRGALGLPAAAVPPPVKPTIAERSALRRRD